MRTERDIDKTPQGSTSRRQAVHPESDTDLFFLCFPLDQISLLSMIIELLRPVQVGDPYRPERIIIQSHEAAITTVGWQREPMVFSTFEFSSTTVPLSKAFHFSQKELDNWSAHREASGANANMDFPQSPISWAGIADCEKNHILDPDSLRIVESSGLVGQVVPLQVTSFSCSRTRSQNR